MAYLYANTSPDDYVAADSVKIHVSGKLYGLKLTGVDSKAEWNDILNTGKPEALPDGTRRSVLQSGKVRNSELGNYRFYYTAGVLNELGLPSGRTASFILPMIDGCSPDQSRQNTGMLKSGYEWSYELYTTGKRLSEGAFITVEPVFSYVGNGAGKAVPAELFYSQTFGGGLHRNVEIGDENDRKNGKVSSIDGSIYYYSLIKAENCSYPLEGNTCLQKWRFSYSLPSVFTVLVDGKRVTDGFLTVAFRITAVDQNGKKVLTYSPDGEKGYCNMWAMEGQPLDRTDYYGRSFTIEYGDVILLDISQSKADDYDPDHRY